MISVRYSDRLGNNLFQFALGLVLSTISGAELRADSIAGFSGTVGYMRPSSTGALVDERLLLSAGLDGVAELARSQDLIVSGWPHRPEYYSAHKSLLCEKLRPDDGDYFSADAPVIHLRLGDYFRGHPKAVAEHAYPVEAVAQAALSLGAERYYILTDEPSSPLASQVMAMLPSAHLVSRSVMHDYRTIYNAKRVVCSPSTFSFWPAWTGKAERILFPQGMACWREDRHPLYAIADPRVTTFTASEQPISQAAAQRLGGWPSLSGKTGS